MQLAKGLTTVVKLAAATLAAGLLVGAAAGCAEKCHPLAEYGVDLPSHVHLPPGFYPLKGHADFDNADDTYDGWPRYIFSERDEMIMVYVPSMDLYMGGGIRPDEVPGRQVAVNHFYIDLHEVSNIQFHRYFDDESCGPDAYREYWVPGLNNADPVRNVTWRQANSYARWSHKYLPTEAQWEAAARGNDGRIYPWGNDAVSEVTRFLCNARTGVDDYDGYTYAAPVMNFAPGVSPFGAFNMSGNVWEWCVDYYDPGRYGYPSLEDPPAPLVRGPKEFGDENYPNPLQKDIREARVGPLRGQERVIRGGSFTDPIERCRVDSRAGAGPDTHQYNVGFRCVLLLPPTEMVEAN